MPQVGPIQAGEPQSVYIIQALIIVRLLSTSHPSRQSHPSLQLHFQQPKATLIF